MVIAIGGILGLIAISLAAFADHGLKGSMAPDHFESVKTAIRYNQFNAILIVALGLAQAASDRLSSVRMIRWASYMLIAGTVLFCFSIYIGRIMAIEPVLVLTPVGGVLQQLGWLMLAIGGVQIARQNHRR